MILTISNATDFKNDKDLVLYEAVKRNAELAWPWNLESWSRCWEIKVNIYVAILAAHPAVEV